MEAVLSWAQKCISDCLPKIEAAKRFRVSLLYNLIKRLLQGSAGQLSVTHGNQFLQFGQALPHFPQDRAIRQQGRRFVCSTKQLPG